MASRSVQSIDALNKAATVSFKTFTGSFRCFMIRQIEQQIVFVVRESKCLGNLVLKYTEPPD